MSEADLLKEALDTLEWIARRFAEEQNKALTGERAEWKRACNEAYNEACGTISRVQYHQETLQLAARESGK